MAHCPYDKLTDLELELDGIRAWPNIVEMSQGVFYVKSKPFLHFHEKDGQRWADCKVGTSWQKIEVPFGAKKMGRAAFLKAAKKLYEAMYP